MDCEPVQADDSKPPEAEHLPDFWKQLSKQEQEALISQVTANNVKEVVAAFKECLLQSKEVFSPVKLSPPCTDSYVSSRCLSADQLTDLWKKGLEAISKSQVAVILLSGGQGTRLGDPNPKGMYDLKLLSKKSLFQIQAERILRLKRLSEEEFSTSDVRITWYVMTSVSTTEPITRFFVENDYFGLPAEDVIFFEQISIPCLDLNGNLILDSPSHFSVAPDGNGGLYTALKRCGILLHMRLRDVRYLHVYCVDNILVRVADPFFVGYCIKHEADCGVKVIEKVDATEPIGVVCSVKGIGPSVVEYSEIPQQAAQHRDPDGRLTFRAGNIANHFFTLDFLERVCEEKNGLPYHLAKKKIPCIDSSCNFIKPSSPNGYKLEKFVFDVFRYAERFRVYEVPRASEFSPLKNSDAQKIDCPKTCRQDLYRLHRLWLEDAGATVEDVGSSTVTPCEISPLVSYCGEVASEERPISNVREGMNSAYVEQASATAFVTIGVALLSSAVVVVLLILCVSRKKPQRSSADAVFSAAAALFRKGMQSSSETLQSLKGAFTNRSNERAPSGTSKSDQAQCKTNAEESKEKERSLLPSPAP